MKKVLLFIMLLLCSYFSYSQTQTHQDWKLMAPKQWGSFYWKVDRSTYKDANGYYWYYVYFYSNSLFNTDKNKDGKLDKAITYIKNVYVYKHEMNMTANSTIYLRAQYVVCDYYYDTRQFFFYFTSVNPNCTFNVKYESASPYTYSNK